MRNLGRLPPCYWFGAVTVLAFLFLASTPASQVLGREESGVGTGWPLSSMASNQVLPHKRLAGLGSSPPNCISKCGSCSPCEPVLVHINSHARTLSPDYKPQVWRCKCGNKLFIP